MLKIEIISPAGHIFEGACLMTIVPSVAGEIGVMEGHEAFVSALKEGKIVVYNEKQEAIKNLEIKGGFAEINDGKKLIILVD